MPMTLQLDQVSFGFEVARDEEENLVAIALVFEEQAPQPGMRFPGVSRIAIPFSPDAWMNFKRAVAADGQLSPITLAHAVPRMDVPKGV